MRHSCIHTTTHSQGLRAFTLIELLLVVGLMLIIMSFSVPAFRRLANGKAVDVSSRMIANQLRLTRAAAISEQKYLALVMPGAKFKAPTATGMEEYHFRAFRVAEVEVTNNSKEFKLVRWYPGTEWTFLPLGAVIAEVNDKYLGGGNEVSGDDVKRDVNMNWLKDNEDASGNKIDKIELKDDQGAVSKVMDGHKKLASGKDNDNAATAYARAVVFDPKGRCTNGKGGIADTRYITLLEANIDPDNHVDMTEFDKLSMRIIKVGKETGRVEYIDIFR